MHEFVDEFFANFVHEFKYEIRTNSRVRIRMNFLREKLVMLRMACTVISGKNLQYEVATLKEYMIKEFTRKNREPIYEPDQFEKFCMEAGAPTLFNNILLSMTSDRHSEQRHNQNKILTVTLIYKLCFGLSQQANYLQRDNTIFMLTNNINKEAMNTERSLGPACSRSSGYRFLHSIEKKNIQRW